MYTELGYLVIYEYFGLTNFKQVYRIVLTLLEANGRWSVLSIDPNPDLLAYSKTVAFGFLGERTVYLND